MFAVKLALKNTIKTVFVILLLFVFYSDATENKLEVSYDEMGAEEDSLATTKTQGERADSSDYSLQNIEDRSDNSKFEKSDKKLPDKNDDSKIEGCNSIYGDSRKTDTVDESKQSSNTQDENGTDEESNDLSRSQQQQQPAKSQDRPNNRRTNLNDVDSFASGEDNPQMKKRDTNEYLGMPRDASYFFDDHEPFLNNNSDYRVGRAAPLHETRSQKVKLNSRGKESIGNDMDEEVNEVENEETEEESVKEEDYDNDDEDEEAECQPTTSGCSTTTSCPTTTTCSTSTTCPTTSSTTTACPTTKSTTECTSTTKQCKPSTKCPKICAKANRKQMGFPVTTVNAFEWDNEKKKFNFKKRRYHSKIADVK